ncbi:MAG: hypothetical protein AVDCRST_MAG60-2636 [uncultured Nocardioides sp.]|uniref:Uncharacterized protein n=1 Tax=uncultured Nocardioides sp. TaxID=198441 RepID=A0A6J4PAB2_9ACTN|nr:MAG: hypothetical protein AVDCRST_MAG60-2636 [uncultured Nocardioides sp.]
MRSFRRASSPTIEVRSGERVLAACESVDGVVLAGTRDALYLGSIRIPWEQVGAADWDNESDVFRVSLVGSWGDDKVVHSFGLTEPGRLLELVRERVTASVVLQRHVPLSSRRGLRVIGRRPPRGDAGIEWFFEYDEGVDPADPAVRDASAAALAAARADVGL